MRYHLEFGWPYWFVVDRFNIVYFQSRDIEECRTWIAEHEKEVA